MTAQDEELVTGWGPGTPPGDNLCNDFVQESAASFAAFAEARGDRVERIEGFATLCDAGSPLPFSNRAVLEQPIGDADALLDQLGSFYGDALTAPYLVDSAWPTPDLRPHGLALMGHPPLMIRASDASLPAAPPELRIVAVTDDRTAYDYEHALVYGYPAPMLQPLTDVTLLVPGALDAPGWQHFVGYVDDRPVASASAYVGSRLVRVDNIATLEEGRGRGYGLAMTAAALAVDLSKPATLIASDLGRPVYERLGFVTLLRVTYWIGTRGGTA